MKKIVLAFILFMIPMMTFALVQQSPSYYVTDDADVVKEETENYIIEYSNFLARSRGVRYYVVTVSSLEGYDIDTYVDLVYQSFGMGKKGVLLFLSQSDGMVKVVFGPRVSSIMTEEEMNQTIDEYFLPYLSAGNWDKGVKNGYIAFYKKICEYYHIDSSIMELESGNSIFIKYQYPILAGMLVASMFVSYYLCSFFYRSKRKKQFYHYFLFFLTCFINVALLALAYFMNPWMILLVLGCEVLAATSVFGNSSHESLDDAFRKIKRDEMRKKKQKNNYKVQKRKVKK